MKKDLFYEILVFPCATSFKYVSFVTNGREHRSGPAVKITLCPLGTGRQSYKE